MPGAAWTRFLAVGSAAVATYVFLPVAAQNVLTALLGVGGVSAIVYGTRLHRPAHRTAWYLVAAAGATWFLGDLAFASYDLRGLESPSPSYADAIYLAGYPLVLVAFTRVLRRTGERDGSAWQDAGIWVTGVALLSYEWLITPILQDQDTTGPAQAIALTYPVMDLALLLLLLRIVAGRIRRPGVPVGLCLAVLAFLASDVLYGVQAVQGIYVSGGWVDLGWLMASVLVGTCALHPRMVEVTEPVEQHVRSRSGVCGAPGCSSRCCWPPGCWPTSRSGPTRWTGSSSPWLR